MDETERIAFQFASTLKLGDVVAYYGSMGAGKTAFTRGVVDGLGISDRVTSPTFALVNAYALEEVTVYHFDMYRVSSFQDLYSTGFFDYMDETAILLIEWSENIESYLPKNIIRITFEILGDQTRKITIREGRNL